MFVSRSEQISTLAGSVLRWSFATKTSRHARLGHIRVRFGSDKDGQEFLRGIRTGCQYR
jgi:hypothetical protein